MQAFASVEVTTDHITRAIEKLGLQPPNLKQSLDINNQVLYLKLNALSTASAVELQAGFTDEEIRIIYDTLPVAVKQAMYPILNEFRWEASVAPESEQPQEWDPPLEYPEYEEDDVIPSSPVALDPEDEHPDFDEKLPHITSDQIISGLKHHGVPPNELRYKVAASQPDSKMIQIIEQYKLQHKLLIENMYSMMGKFYTEQELQVLFNNLEEDLRYSIFISSR